MKLHLIRHAKTNANSKGELSCDTEEPLNVDGTHQAEVLSNYLESFSFDEIWCSPLIRARQTLVPFLKRTNTEPQCIPLLCEGQLNLDASASILEPEFLETSGLPRMPESIGCFRGRVAGVLAKARDVDADLAVICITHGHFIREILNIFLGTSNYTRFPIENCSDTLIEIGEHQIIHYVNRTTI